MSIVSTGAWTAGAGDGSSTSGTNKKFESSAFGNNKFVALDNVYNTLYSTDNAVTWTRQTIGSGTSSDITYGNGRFVIVGGNSAASQVPQATVQLDGTTTWNAGGPMGVWQTNALPDTVAFGNGIFVAISGQNTESGVWTSTDGQTWSAPLTNTSLTLGSQAGNLGFGGGYFLVGGNNGHVVFLNKWHNLVFIFFWNSVFHVHKRHWLR